jgi:hypothetical protein
MELFICAHVLYIHIGASSLDDCSAQVFPYNIFAYCSICRVDCKFARNKKNVLYDYIWHFFCPGCYLNLCISTRQVPCSILGPDIGWSDWKFMCVSSLPPAKPEWGPTCSCQVFLGSSFICRPIMWGYKFLILIEPLNKTPNWIWWYDFLSPACSYPERNVVTWFVFPFLFIHEIIKDSLNNEAINKSFDLFIFNCRYAFEVNQ